MGSNCSQMAGMLETLTINGLICAPNFDARSLNQPYPAVDLETLAVDECRASLVVLLLGAPHLLERR